MRKFSELDIKPVESGFAGPKIKIEKILNREITVLDYKIVPSRFENKGDCLYLQIEFNGIKHLLFSGSKFLVDMIQRAGKESLPFTTIIQKENEHFEFT